MEKRGGDTLRRQIYETRSKGRSCSGCQKATRQVGLDDWKVSAVKTERIPVRATPEEKQTIQRAAICRRLSASSFLITSALKVIRDEDHELSESDRYFESQVQGTGA